MPLPLRSRKAKICPLPRTSLEPEPKVGIRHIDLLKLYQRVVEEGGYDLCSDTKAKPLMWRKLAEEFVGRNPYTAAQAFQIKNVYYKNLCAYEISTYWQKEPPPKEILEEVTAKGGNVMTRTLENFVKATARERESLQDGEGSDASPEHKTPQGDKTDTPDDPGSATGRSTRGLRQQPPQRVLFQPDLNPARQTRGQLQAAHASPSPSVGINGIMNATSLTNGASATLASYEPSQTYPLSLRPVITPANNPEFYRNERKRKLEAKAGPLARKYRNIMLPGTGFIGPNIYVRAQLALQSGVPDEEEYALHHLVKISHERGDKYRFDQFPGLADALIKKVLQITGLFYDVDWEVTYDEDTFSYDEETLNGLIGTPDVIQRLKSRVPLISDDSVLDDRFVSQLNRITEAGLILRNMSLQDENANYLARLPLLRDLLAIMLNLPSHASIVELQHYALDIAEQVLKLIDLGTQDDLYQGLLNHAAGNDRSASATAFRAISRIAMNHPSPKRLDDVPLTVLQRAQDFLFVEDEELRSACLDFLMQYTSFADNVEHLLYCLDTEALARQLSRLLLFSAKEHRDQRPPTRQEADHFLPPVPRISRSVIDGLLELDEPQRSSEWLRMCFLPDPNTEMTQISLWQAYQSTFGPYHASHPHLIAGEFIKNVSSTFQGATAQVAGSNKYVIRGIKSRKVPIDIGIGVGSRGTNKGKELSSCYWKIIVPVDGSRDPHTGLMSAPSTREDKCGEWFRTADDMLKHILQDHLQLPKKIDESRDGDKMDVDSMANSPSTPVDGLPNGTSATPYPDRFDFDTADKTTYRCRWSECERTSPEYDGGKVSRTILFARHIGTHLPEADNPHSKYNLKPDTVRPSTSSEVLRLSTLEDEKGDAAGLPLRAALVLRNIARFMPQRPGQTNTMVPTRSAQEKEDPEEFAMTVFDDEVRDRLFYAMTHNQTIKDYVGSIFRSIRRSTA